MSLAFCMGPDLQVLLDSPQPMAVIFKNGFGEKGTLAVWAVVVLVQYVPFHSFTPISRAVVEMETLIL